MPLEPADVFGLPRDARCDTLDAYQQNLLAARFGAGATPEDIAEAWGYSPQTIYRDLRRITDIVLGHTGLDTNPVLMARWFDMHLDDCLPVARELIEKRTVLTRPPPPHERHHAA